MRRLSVAILTLLVASASASPSVMQNTNSPTAAQGSNTNARRAVKRGPVFRATKEQIKQAQVTWNNNSVKFSNSKSLRDPHTLSEQEFYSYGVLFY